MGLGAHLREGLRARGAPAEAGEKSPGASRAAKAVMHSTIPTTRDASMTCP